jgi:hypothetical protein
VGISSDDEPGGADVADGVDGTDGADGVDGEEAGEGWTVGGVLTKIFENVSAGAAAGGGVGWGNGRFTKGRTVGIGEGFSETGDAVGAGVGCSVSSSCGAHPKPGQSSAGGGHIELPNPMLTIIESGEMDVPLTTLHT